VALKSPSTVSNADKINILCKYLLYILTDNRLILTNDRSDLLSEKADPSGTALARTAATVNCRPALSLERALLNNKPATV
jgi:hypothetical protein